MIPRMTALQQPFIRFGSTPFPQPTKASLYPEALRQKVAQISKTEPLNLYTANFIDEVPVSNAILQQLQQTVQTYGEAFRKALIEQNKTLKALPNTEGARKTNEAILNQPLEAWALREFKISVLITLGLEREPNESRACH